jgi:hypothetical protein
MPSESRFALNRQCAYREIEQEALGRMYGRPSDCKEKAKGEKTSLRKCIRPLMEHSAPGQDELRAYLSLLVGRLL